MRSLAVLSLAAVLPAQELAPHLVKAHMPEIEYTSQSVGLADLDGDGSLDLFSFGRGDGSQHVVAVHLNDGFGRFALGPVPVLAPTSDDDPDDPVFADIDGDGDVDVIVPTTDTDIYVNNGAAGLVNQGPLRLGGDFDGVGGVDAGDIDGDGDVDLIFPTALFRNNGLGSFQNVSATQLIDGSGARPKFGDIDGDGDLDLVTAFTISINDGSGTFTEDTAPRMPIGQDPGVLALEDFDGDGDLDIFSGDGNRILFNVGGGFFTATQLPGVFSSTSQYAVADFDMDGNVDIAFRPPTSPSLTVLWNTGGVFVRQDEVVIVDGNVVAITTGDVDGNGAPDIVFGRVGVNIGTIFAVNVAPHRNDVLLSDGLGGFARGVFHDYGVRLIGGITTPAIADIDGDGDLDVYTGAIRRNLGNATFELAFNAPVYTNGQFADADGDGELDLFGREPLAPVIRLSKNVGGVFSDSSSSLPAGAVNVGRFLVADLDDDGDPDIITARSSTDAIFVNDGTGQFTEAVGALTPLRTGSAVFATADLDGDGDTDVLRTSASLTEIYYGDGVGNFAADPTPYPGGSHVIPADFDNDGDVDWVVSEQFQLQSPWLYRNEGGGVFTQIAIPLGFPPKWATDFDGDGLLDLVADGAILRNRPSGFFVFTTAQLGLPEGSSLVRSAEDLDRDGDNDLLILRESSAASVGINRTVHLRSPFVPRVGGELRLVASSNSLGFPGQNGGTTFAFLLGFGLAPTPAPTPFGSLALDPQVIVAAGSGVADAIDADVALDLAVPNNPAIAGLDVFFQALALVPKATGAEFRLTSFTVDELLP